MENVDDLRRHLAFVQQIEVGEMLAPEARDAIRLLARLLRDLYERMGVL